MRSLLPLLLLGACGRAPAPEPPPAGAGFVRKRPPLPGEWLAVHPEEGQTFEDYVASDPVRAQPGEAIAFLPVGPFSPAERDLFDASAAFAGIWFDLPVKVLPGAPLPETGWQRGRGDGTQYRTKWFLDHLLPDRMPPDVVSLFGLTMADLYPDEEWNFVFGEASLRGRVGVWSFRRFGGDGPEQTLRRGLKVVVHEIGHAFGLEHCVEWECAMNGSNSLAETDAQPLFLCPVCLRKLQWNRGFDVAARYRRMREFLGARGFEAETRWLSDRLRAME